MPIFLALAVLYKYIAIITANVLYPQPEHFANAQTGGIDSMEYGPVLNVFRVVQQKPHFFHAQHIRQILAFLRPRYGVIFPRHPQRMFIITLNSVDKEVLFLLADGVFGSQLKNKPLYLFLG